MELERALVLVDADYERGLAELRDVRDRAREAARARFGSTPEERFAVGTNQFHVAHGRTACTAAAAAAALYVLNFVADEADPAGAMLRVPWDVVVESGARLWLEYADSATGRAASPGGHVAFEQLMACGGMYCSTVRRVVRTVAEVAGHTNDAVTAVLDTGAGAVTLTAAVVQMPPDSAMIITATAGAGAADAAGATVAVVRFGRGDCWVFDSHGARDTRDAALLCHCASAGAAALVLAEQLPDGLFSAAIVQRAPRRVPDAKQ